MVMLVAALFSFLAFLCVLSVVVGLPGTWIILFLATVIELTDIYWLEGHPAVTFGWWVLGIALVVAVAGEVLELVSGMIGTKAGGGTRKGMLGAIGGGMIGALGGTFVVPIPVIGTLVGVLLGTFGGAMWGEMTSAQGKREAKDAWKPAMAATFARALGTVAKAGVAMVVWAGLSVAAFLP